MHELSVAMGIVKIAEDVVEKEKAKSVDLIELEIGTLAGIEFDSLDFVWESAVKNTVLEHAKKRINRIKAKARCVDCDTVFELQHLYDSCPECHSNFKGILKGKELRVKALEII
ncbi:hydrogenase maturation nickel metallochaperone HypA [Aestuariivivens sediminis]|uniref:hydrogenase maturation nickel metallochaperone HypA n=1 Tax=Aestuariivivens sediminis TaxID=2913557 RepID=UPI001F597605|nr:hydrogenase maturation nickel metallochaperone HypA [Aestuariivivens sediminis]